MLMKKRYRLMAATGLVATLLLGACGSDEEAPKATAAATKAAATAIAAATKAATEAPKATAAATKAATEAPKATAAASTAVTIKEFTFEVPATVKAGAVTFAAKNAGAAPHELAIIKTDAADVKKLPVKDGLLDEAVNKPLGRTPQIAAGASADLKVTLTAGKYALICNVPGHYSLGMAVPITVN